tara:strand:+ start:251 stop:463 length:213 start_codon:yes stop_codon:yes gene_type:complete
MYNNIHKDNDINIGFKNILIFIEGDLYVTLTANSIINNTTNKKPPINCFNEYNFIFNLINIFIKKYFNLK